MSESSIGGRRENLKANLMAPRYLPRVSPLAKELTQAMMCSMVGERGSTIGYEVVVKIDHADRPDREHRQDPRIEASWIRRPCSKARCPGKRHAGLQEGAEVDCNAFRIEVMRWSGGSDQDFCGGPRLSSRLQAGMR